MHFIKNTIRLFLIFCGWIWLLGAFFSWFIVDETTKKIDFWTSFQTCLLFLAFTYITFWLAYKLKNKSNISYNDLETNTTTEENNFETNDKFKIKNNTEIKDIFNEDNEALNHFNKCLDIVNQQKTNELLEVLIEFEDLDKAYLKVKNTNPKFMPRNLYDETKLNILDNIISDKFRKYSGSKKKKNEKMKSLLDELYVCKRRYPEYKEILEKHITNVNSNINNN